MLPTWHRQEWRSVGRLWACRAGILKDELGVLARSRNRELSSLSPDWPAPPGLAAHVYYHRFGAHARTLVNGEVLLGIENYSNCYHRLVGTTIRSTCSPRSRLWYPYALSLSERRYRA